MIHDKKTTDALEEILMSSGAEKLGDFFDSYADKLADGDRPFTDYMRDMFRQKGIRQNELFIAADIDEKTGYRIISGEKHTSNRNFILRICIAAGFNVDEINTALKYYGMSPLYARIPGDAIIINAVSNGIRDVWEVNDLLSQLSPNHHLI